MTTFFGPGSDSGPSFSCRRVGAITFIETQAQADSICMVASAIVCVQLDDQASVMYRCVRGVWLERADLLNPIRYCR